MVRVMNGNVQAVAVMALPLIYYIKNNSMIYFAQ
jgi:hypothetical protein